MGYCEYCGASRQKKICPDCKKQFIACDCDQICDDCANWQELEEIENGTTILEYTQDGEGDGIIAFGPMEWS